MSTLLPHDHFPWAFSVTALALCRRCGLVQCPAPPANNFHLIDSYNNTFKCVRTLSAEEDSQYCEFDDDEHFVCVKHHASGNHFVCVRPVLD